MKHKQLVKQLIRRLGFELRRLPSPPTTPDTAQQSCFSTLLRLRELTGSRLDSGEDWRFLAFCERHLGESRAQLLQDLFVLYTLQEPRNGYFVEFGATDGLSLSNTQALEKLYGWAGIVAEPARCWHPELRRNRNCIVDLRCVWSTTGERLQFKEVASGPELSTVSMHAESDHFQAERLRSGVDYEVESVSLMDLLRQHGAPRTIDYLSVDTEGSELKILQGFDFSAYDVRVLTVEHNHTANRAAIHGLLSGQGFERRFPEFSAWDDWYVRV